MNISHGTLPQLSNDIFITDGGIETTLIFHDGFDLPEFAAFTLLAHEKGREALKKYFLKYVNIAQAYGVGIILESATWRANHEWGVKLGYSETQLAEFNRQAIELLCEVRDKYQSVPMVISGCVGPRGDGYRPEHTMTATEAQAYHSAQITTFRNMAVDMVSAITMNYIEEAIGIAWAAKAARMPVVIAFTVETDGCLPTGQSLQEAIEAVDQATDQTPAYYMINCAHPTHFEDVLVGGDWLKRIRGVRANASAKSHAELNDSQELDSGNPSEFGLQHLALAQRLDHLRVYGGCCGTDHRHIEAICQVIAAR